MNDYRQQGKTARTIWLAQYCVVANRSLFIASSNPDWWYDVLTKDVPEAKLIKHKHGVSIEKS